LSNFQPAGLHPDTDRKVQEESVERQGTAETLFVVDVSIC